MAVAPAVTSTGAAAAASGPSTGSGGKASGFAYRPDIDALRGAAMLAVLVFHLNKSWLPGGFTGVDIFFVISGYVVMGSLLGQASRPLGPRLGMFYLRRVRRLMPNLLACLGVTSLGVAMLIPPLESGPYFNVALKSLFGWSNNFLMGQIDYFATDADLNPFLHTWSLGVEQQFYLVFPLLLLGIGYGVRRSVPLLAGAALLLWAVVMTSEREGFPVPGVLPAVVGTLLVLQAGPGEGGRFLPGRWLERFLLTCGLLSYSLYLWHWPVIVLLRWTWGMETWWQYVVAVAGSVVLAVAAYGLVEQPVRRHPLKWWWETLLALLAVVGLWIGIDALHHPLRGKLFLGKDADPVPISERVHALNPLIPGTGITSDCTVPSGKPYDATTRPNFDKCNRPGLPGAREIFLLGDSHAQHLLPMLDAVTSRTGQRLTFAAMGACLIDPELTVIWQQGRYESCRQFSAGEMARSLQRLQPGDIVLVSGFLHNYLASNDLEGRGSGAPTYRGDRRLRVAEVRQAWVASMRGYAQRLASRSIQLVLVVDNPSLAREPVACQDPAGSSCAGDAATTARMRATLRGLLGEVAAGLPNVHVFDPTPYLVGPDGRVVYRRPDGTPLYADSHHLSVSGSRSLAGPFERFLQQQGLTSPRPTPSPPSP